MKKTHRRSATSKVLETVKSPEESLELLRDTLPQKLRPAASDGTAALWTATSVYMHQLAGKNPSFRIKPNLTVSQQAITARDRLRSQLPAGYTSGFLQGKRDILVATAAVAYIREELRPLFQPVKPGSASKGKMEAKLKAKSTEAASIAHKQIDLGDKIVEAGRQDDAVANAATCLRDHILKYKTEAIGLDNAKQLVKAGEDMVKDLDRNSQDIIDFGARGDGDFERLASGVYCLRGYFFDEVPDIEKIDNLLLLIKRARDVVKIMNRDMVTLKEYFKFDSVAKEGTVTTKTNSPKNPSPTGQTLRAYHATTTTVQGGSSCDFEGAKAATPVSKETVTYEESLSEWGSAWTISVA